MKAKKIVRWVITLSLTGVCAALAVVALDAWTARPQPAAAGDPERTARASSAMGVERTSLVAPRPAAETGAGAAETAPAAPGAGILVVDEEGRLLEQIETARSGLLAAQATMPARAVSPSWLPVSLLAGGGLLIGCACGLGLAVAFLRRRGLARKGNESARDRALAGAPAGGAPGIDPSASEVVRAARAELAKRITQGRAAPPSATPPSGAPPSEAPPSEAPPLPGPLPAASAPRPAGISAPAAATPVATTVPSSGAPPATSGSLRKAPWSAREREIEDALTRPQENADPVDRRLCSLERSLLHVVRAMEEVAQRVSEREEPRAVAKAPAAPAPVVAAVPSYIGDLEGDRLAPRARRPLARKEADQPAASLKASATRPAAGLARTVRALRASQEHAAAAAATAAAAAAAAATTAAGPAGSVTPPHGVPRLDADSPVPSAATADGRDLARIRRAVLRLAEEGWTSERIAGRLRLGVGDVALIRKTAGSGQSLQAAGRS